MAEKEKKKRKRACIGVGFPRGVGPQHESGGDRKKKLQIYKQREGGGEGERKH